MKTIVLYTRVVKSAREQGAPASSYDERTERFFTSYRKFKPLQDHELVVCNCGGVSQDLRLIDYRMIEYYGHGWDLGSYQFAANALDCDLLVCCNAGTFFRSKEWLYPLVSARGHYGPGIYGVSASYERGPHLRTPCIAIDPALFRDYPIAVIDRERCNRCEAGPDSITNFVRKIGKPALLMTPTAAYEMKDWRRADIPNIFRRGDQSNVMVWDRHLELFEQATPDEKLRLARLADTL